jgi:hypothetical protein
MVMHISPLLPTIDGIMVACVNDVMRAMNSPQFTITVESSFVIAILHPLAKGSTPTKRDVALPMITTTSPLIHAVQIVLFFELPTIAVGAHIHCGRWANVKT